MGGEPAFPPASVLVWCFIPPIDSRNEKGKQEADAAVTIAEKMGKCAINFLQLNFFIPE